MTEALKAGTAATLERCMTPGAGRTIARPTRVTVRTEQVTVLGAVAFEPNMLRVRRASGEVIRVYADQLAA